MMTIDTAAIKQAATGKWVEILASLGGVDPALLDGKHHPCPRCGGTDRFRMIDPEVGALFCNQCFSEKNGDGISALGWLCGWDFAETVKQLGEHLGMGANGDGRVNAAPNIVATYDYRDEKGELLFQVCRLDPKSFRQRKPAGEGKWDWHVKGLRVIPYRLPELLAADPSTTIYVLEGEKDCDRAYSGGLMATTNPMGAFKWRKEHAEFLRGRRVAIIPDNDGDGTKHVQQVAASLVGKAALIKVLELPGLPPKGDLSDWLDAGGTVEELTRLVEAAPLVTAEDVAGWKRQGEPQPSERPEIAIGVDEARVVNEAIQALANREDTFVRGSILAHVVREATPPKSIARPKGSPRIAGLRLPTLRERLADSAKWTRFMGEDKPPEATHPPEWAIKAVDARGEWPGVRRLEGITEIPVLRADGSILQTPGYDEQTGLLFMPQEAFPPIAEKPAAEDVLKAVEAIHEVVADFPFAGPADRSAWLAGLLTPLARYAFHGPAPLIFIDANRPATGKSLLIDAIGMIVAGREMPRMVVPREDDETRKRILAVALAGDAMILLDNAAGFFGSPAMDAALTATSWSDRILGRSQTVTAPLTATFYGTGNNVIFRADTSRRILPVRLETKDETPEERQGFRHPELLVWVRSERPRLAAAALTILAGYAAAGRPDQSLPPWGSFEAWSALVRNAVAWVTAIDPAGGRRELMARSDEDMTILKSLLDGWQDVDPAGHGLSVSEALRRVVNAHEGQYDILRSVLWEACPSKDGKSFSPRSLGMKLHHLRRRVLGARYFDSKPGRIGEIWRVYVI